MRTSLGLIWMAVLLVDICDCASTNPPAVVQSFSDHITFDVFTNNFPNNTYTLNQLSENLLEKTHCNPEDRLAFIVPGWQDSGDEKWVLEAVDNYLEFRGGCVVVMKWGYYALNINYFAVVRQFRDIALVLHQALQTFFDAGFTPEQTYGYGFSLGSRLLMYAAHELLPLLLEQLDLCDPAGFGFDGYKAHANFQIQGLAKRSTCIHTSSFFGTSEMRCDVDWVLGECGKKQAAAVSISDSHKLCPKFWNIAFRHEFAAVPCNATKCGRVEREATVLGDADGRFYMGYQEEFRYADGVYCADTFKSEPYYSLEACAEAEARTKAEKKAASASAAAAAVVVKLVKSK